MFLQVRDHPRCATAEAHPLEVSQQERGWSLLLKSPQPRKEDSALRLFVALQSPPPFHSYKSYLTTQSKQSQLIESIENTQTPDTDPFNLTSPPHAKYRTNEAETSLR